MPRDVACASCIWRCMRNPRVALGSPARRERTSFPLARCSSAAHSAGLSRRPSGPRMPGKQARGREGGREGRREGLEGERCRVSRPAYSVHYDQTHRIKNMNTHLRISPLPSPSLCRFQTNNSPSHRYPPSLLIAFRFPILTRSSKIRCRKIPHYSKSGHGCKLKSSYLVYYAHTVPGHLRVS